MGGWNLGSSSLSGPQLRRAGLCNSDGKPSTPWGPLSASPNFGLPIPTLPGVLAHNVVIPLNACFGFLSPHLQPSPHPLFASTPLLLAVVYNSEGEVGDGCEDERILVDVTLENQFETESICAASTVTTARLSSSFVYFERESQHESSFQSKSFISLRN